MKQEYDYGREGVELLVNGLEKSHYEIISALCVIVQNQAKRLEELETSSSPSNYTSKCLKLAEDIEAFIKSQRAYLLPYLHSLFEKTAAGHDCHNCGANCSAQHSMHLMEFKQQHKALKELLNRLQMAVLPLYAETIYPDAYRLLRNQMALIENSLADLFFIEESYLIPQVEEAQKKMNAHD